MSDETIISDLTTQTRLLDKAGIKYTTREWAHGIAIIIEDNADCWLYFNKHNELVSARVYTL